MTTRIDRKNSEKEFLKRVEDHKGILFKICKHYCQGDEANQDLMQEILAVLWLAYDKYRGEASFSTWMYKVALNTAITHVRKEKRSIQKEPLHPLFEVPESNENEIDQEINLLEKAIRQLSKIEKAIIFLYLEKKSYEEIAQIIGTNKNNIGVKISRIKNKLKIIMEKENHG